MKKIMKIVMIVVCLENGVIGKDGGLFWFMFVDEVFFLNEIEGCFFLLGWKFYEFNQGNIIFKDKQFVIIIWWENYKVGFGGEIVYSVEEGIVLARYK